MFQFFSKELWICRWWAVPVPEAGPPCGRAGTRGRPTAAERISVFKAFENKLLQFPGCRVGGGRGVPGGGFACSPGRGGSRQVRRVSRSTSPRPPPVWLELPGLPAHPRLQPWGPAEYLGRVCEPCGNLAERVGRREVAKFIFFPPCLGFSCFPFFSFGVFSVSGTA